MLETARKSPYALAHFRTHLDAHQVCMHDNAAMRCHVPQPDASRWVSTLQVSTVYQK